MTDIFFKYPLLGIAFMGTVCIFVTVFHRILDFKDGAGFLSWPHFFCTNFLQIRQVLSVQSVLCFHLL